MSGAIRIYGVDFSGARDPSRGLYVASGTLDVEAGQFVLERCEPCDDRLDVFAKLLQSPPDALWAVDAPFAPAFPAYERMGFTEWEEWLDFAAGSSRSSFLAALEAVFPPYESPCKAYDWACRRTDVAAGAASPFKAVNPNLRAMSYAAWKLLSYARTAGCAVYPFDFSAIGTARSAPALFEVYPSHTARLLRGSRSLDVRSIANALPRPCGLERRANFGRGGVSSDAGRCGRLRRLHDAGGGLLCGTRGAPRRRLSFVREFGRMERSSPRGAHCSAILRIRCTIAPAPRSSRPAPAPVNKPFSRKKIAYRRRVPTRVTLSWALAYTASTFHKRGEPMNNRSTLRDANAAVPAVPAAPAAPAQDKPSRKIQVVLRNNESYPNQGSTATPSVHPKTLLLQSPFGDIFRELDQMVGLEHVKELVYEIYAMLQISQYRAEAGLQTKPHVFHMIFKGNPGTGKTTVARLIAKLFHRMGVLSKGHFIEVERADLVGEYIGHTAIKTRDLVKKALGGILFIDEAYSLARGGEKDFGKEAIDALVKAMEDHREDFILILAGYSEEMEQFLTLNPGLPSRFPIQIDFGDYSVDELLLIAEQMAKDREYVLLPGAAHRLKQMLTEEKHVFWRSFSNARYVRNMLDKAVRNQAVRLLHQHPNVPSKQELMTIRPEDWPAAKR